jgi:hypothetical protein
MYAIIANADVPADSALAGPAKLESPADRPADLGPPSAGAQFDDGCSRRSGTWNCNKRRGVIPPASPCEVFTAVIIAFRNVPELRYMMITLALRIDRSVNFP